MRAVEAAIRAIAERHRREIVRLVRDRELTAGQIASHFEVSRPAVSQHLRVLRDSGFTSVRAEGTRRLYAVAADPLRDVDAWLDKFRRFWAPPLDALATELARGRRKR